MGFRRAQPQITHSYRKGANKKAEIVQLMNVTLSLALLSPLCVCFPASGGGAGLHHLLAALSHRQEPVCPGGRLRHGHAEPELQHGLHGALLPQRFHQPRRLQPDVTEVQSRRQTPLPAPSETQTSPPRPGAVLHDWPQPHPGRKPDRRLRGSRTGWVGCGSTGLEFQIRTESQFKFRGDSSLSFFERSLSHSSIFTSVCCWVDYTHAPFRSRLCSFISS